LGTTHGFSPALSRRRARGERVERIAEPESQIDDVALASTLPPHALRHLFKHSEVHLNVEWRDLPDAGWGASVGTLDGGLVRIADIPLMRAREVWQRAADLDSKGRLADCPPDLISSG